MKLRPHAALLCAHSRAGKRLQVVLRLNPKPTRGVDRDAGGGACADNRPGKRSRKKEERTDGVMMVLVQTGCAVHACGQQGAVLRQLFYVKTV